MRGLRCLHTLAFVILLVSPALAAPLTACTYNVGVFALGSTGVSLQQYEVTFNQYLNSVLAPVLGCSFAVTPLYATTALFDGVADGTIDFAFADAATYPCIISMFGASPLASIVRLEDGEVTYTVGGSIFARANDTSLQSLADLAGRRVEFAVIGGRFSALPWLLYEEIKSHGVDIFTGTAEVMLADTTDNMIYDLQSGRADAILLRSDVIAHAQERGLITSSSFKAIGAMVQEGYPYPVSTSLLPENVFFATTAIPSDVKKAVALALYQIEEDNYAAKAGSYSTWVPPYSYVSMFQLLQDHNLMLPNGTCLAGADLYQVIACPPQTAKVAESDMPAHCAQNGSPPCQENYLCYCQPCLSLPPAPPPYTAKTTKSAIAKIGAVAFASIVTIIVLLSATIAAVAYKMSQDSKVTMDLHYIAYKDLGLTYQSKILGQSKHGLVLQANYSSMLVAVKLMLPPSKPKTKTLFSPRGPSLTRLSSLDAILPQESELSEGLINGDGGTESPSSKTRLMGHIIAEFSSKQQKRATQLTAKKVFDKLQSALSCLRSCVNGSVYKHIKTRQQAVHKVARYVRVLHPNTVATVGISQCPTTKDLLLVTRCLTGGTLKDAVHNITFELDLEMMLDMLRDIAAAMAYLHSQHPPIAHQSLNSAKILLDSNCGAHLQLDHLQPLQVAVTRRQYWQAPEALIGYQPGAKGTAYTYAMKSSVFAFGMLMYELLHRKEPYQDEDRETTWSALNDKRVSLTKRPIIDPQEVKDVSAPLIKLMQQCWHGNPAVRPTFDSIKATLTDITNDTFNCSAGRASQLKSAKQQALLGQMLPAKVLAALRDGRTPEPEPYDCVTVIFCDIVDFGQLLSTLPPQDVIDMLDRLYHVLDDLALQHQLFKVETIGCTHMVVGNLQNPRPDHTAKAAWFALDAHKLAQTLLISPADATLGYINLKIGIHSGAVVASVVGTTNPRYCLFGDTVNTASRMQSSCLSNKTQMSRDAAHLAMRQDSRLRYHIVPRPGLQNLKGKGPTKTFWVEPETADGKWSDMPVRDSMDSMPSSDISYDAVPQTVHRRSSILSRSSETPLGDSSHRKSEAGQHDLEDTDTQRKSAESVRGSQGPVLQVRRSLSLGIPGSLAALAASNSRGASFQALKETKLYQKGFDA